jgi:dinuclear metal center YbgI/SA1388 family protein
MTTIAQLTGFLESIAPLHLQESYDNAGLIVGRRDAVVLGVLTTLDCTEAVVSEAIQKNCNVVVSHHPIVFKGLKRFNEATYVERVVAMAIKHDIAIYAIHTNLDHVLHSGVNQRIAQQLGLTRCSILATNSNDANTGAGLIGHLETPCAWIDFLLLLHTHMRTQVVRHTQPVSDLISRVAVCGG